MYIGDDQEVTPVSVDEHNMEYVDSFIYLGSLIASNGDMEDNVNHGIGKAAVVFQKMHQIWSGKMIHTPVKIHLYNAIIIPTVTYASEMWKDAASMGQKLDVFHQ